MENATKALLIAAAILIAILIISLSLVVYNMASETAGSVNLSEAEMAQFNAKFTPFVGTKIAGSEVNALVNTVFSHNQSESLAGTGRYVALYKTKKADANQFAGNPADFNELVKFTTGKYYSVTATYDSTGLVQYLVIK